MHIPHTHTCIHVHVHVSFSKLKSHINSIQGMWIRWKSREHERVIVSMFKKEKCSWSRTQKTRWLNEEGNESYERRIQQRKKNWRKPSLKWWNLETVILMKISVESATDVTGQEENRIVDLKDNTARVQYNENISVRIPRHILHWKDQTYGW